MTSINAATLAILTAVTAGQVVIYYAVMRVDRRTRAMDRDLLQIRLRDTTRNVITPVLHHDQRDRGRR